MWGVLAVLQPPSLCCAVSNKDRACIIGPAPQEEIRKTAPPERPTQTENRLRVHLSELDITKPAPN